IASDAVLAGLRETWGEWPPPWLTDDQPVPIPGTAVKTDPSRQIPRPVPVTHYFDLDVLCRAGRRRFIFCSRAKVLVRRPATTTRSAGRTLLRMPQAGTLAGQSKEAV